MKRLGVRVASLALVAVLVGACGVFDRPNQTLLTLPQPTCGGIKVAIENALSCEEVARIAIDALRRLSSVQVPADITAIDVQLATCPVGEVPQQLDCSGEPFVQLVTVTFGPEAPGGPVEPPLVVGIGPASGRVLGIVNPLIR